jgi:hypothetical protein
LIDSFSSRKYNVCRHDRSPSLECEADQELRLRIQPAQCSAA